MAANKIKTLEQGRAKAAYDAVTFMLEKSESVKKKYKSGAKKLPILIQTNGLGQSLAFIQNREGWQEIYRQLGEWLQKNELVPADKPDLVAVVIEKDSYEYRQLTLECLAFLNWLRRFVEGLMQDVEEDS